QRANLCRRTGESVPERLSAAAWRRCRLCYFPWTEYQLLQSEPYEPLHAALAVRGSAATPGQVAARGVVCRQSGHASPRHPGPELHSAAVLQHVTRTRSGGDQSVEFCRPESVLSTSARNEPGRHDRGAFAIAAPLPAIHRYFGRDELGILVVPRAAGPDGETPVERLVAAVLFDLVEVYAGDCVSQPI